MEYGALLVKCGDVEAYRQLRSLALAKWAEDRDASVLQPVLYLGGMMATSASESAQLLKMLRMNQAAAPSAALPIDCTGLVHYRAGEWVEANRSLLQAVKLRSEGENVAVAWAFLAMTHLRLKESAEAEQYLKRVDAWIAEREKQAPPVTAIAPLSWNWSSNLMVRQLRNEAELLRSKPAP